MTAVTTLVLVVSLAGQEAVHAQGAQSAEAAAPVELTGYWVSDVTFDWEFRMVTPRPGDYSDVPLKPAGIQIMSAWDPAKDTAAGLQCKSYGAGNIMRVPGHLHITWQDEQTLKLETDAGQQTRLLHFAPSAGTEQGEKTWQGYSVADWERQQGNSSRSVWGNLKVTTTDMKAGYLRKNGIPYSENAKMLEYFDVVPLGSEVPVQGQDAASNRQGLLIVSSILTDPVYLFTPYYTTEQFLKQSSSAGWEPSACSAMW
jgi:hypothetical protein